MSVDLFTVVAQMINFFVLVLLLKRFLYVPVLDAMERRAAGIKARDEKAEHVMEQAQAQKEQYLSLRREIEQEATILVENAKTEAEQAHAQMAEGLRKELEESRIAWYAALEREKVQSLEELRDSLAELVLASVRRLLTDLTNTSLESVAIEAFIQHVDSLGQSERAHLAKALHAESRVTIQSAFALSEQERERILRCLHPLGLETEKTTFIEAPSLVLGITLGGEGERLSWNASSYLEDLTNDIKAALVKVGNDAA